MRIISALCFYLAVFSLFSCRDSELKRMPDTLPDIEGKIISISRENKDADNASVTILVKALEGIDVRIPEAHITVTEQTLIEDSDGEILSDEVLRQGMEVDIWIDNEMRESFPVQANAVAIRVPNLE